MLPAGTQSGQSVLRGCSGLSPHPTRAVGQFTAQHQPGYFFCGHIHEAEGASVTLGRTRGFNAGKRGYLLEL
jgi:Icc-related predicted phosphoesterase